MAERVVTERTTDFGELWTACSESIKKQVSDATWRTWFAALAPLEFEDSTFVITAPNSLVRERLEGRFCGLVEDALTETFGRPISARFLVNSDAANDIHPDDHRPPGLPGQLSDPLAGVPGVFTFPPPQTAKSEPIRPEPAQTSLKNQKPEAALNPRYTFDAFVIGSSNRFAHAAAQRVAETPAASYNPLFIHGDSGLGKTHLLHAIGHYVAENFSQLHVRYVSTETFMNEFVDAIRTNGQSAFKRRYRDCDVLLVDDIQFMENKEGLQEEFFHTFNSLYEANKQIVLSSDRPPRSIATLEDRLRSRFESGLTTDVQPPELETRLAILRKKAESEPTPIPNDVLELIATHVKDNIRELEGALIRVAAFGSLNRQPITLERAEHVLSDIIDAGRPRQITPKLILEATSNAFGFEVDEICGTSRRRPLVNARQIGMYVFRELTDFSYPAIAREFGGRDHTTVIHAVEKVSGLMKESRQVYDQVTELIHRIKAGG